MKIHFAMVAIAALLATACTARADNTNLLQNAGFEGGGDIPSWQAGTIPPNSDPPITVALDTSVAHSGKSSLRFDRTNKGFFPVAYYGQDIPVDQSGSRLKVGVWVKARAAGKATLAVMFQGPNGKIEWGAYIGGNSPADHDWKHYGAVVAVPSGTTGVTIALEMYGPGTVWFDDVTAYYVPASTPLQAATLTDGDKVQPAADPLEDVKDVPNADSKAGNDPMKRYFLIGPGKATQPAEGYKLLLVLPGGDGSADFNPFIRRVFKNAVPDGYVVAQLVAPKWSTDQASNLVWPTRRQRTPAVKFTTEEFVESVVADVSKKVKIDPSKVFTLSWSSGGPAAYAIALSHGSVKGSFIAMSVFHENELPTLHEAKGLPFYILHSPQDTTCPFAEAQSAADELKKAGGQTKLATYEGGHGWRGDVFAMIHDGIMWLESPK